KSDNRPVVRKRANHGRRGKLRDNSKEQHHYRTNTNSGIDRMSNAITAATAKILTNYRRYGKAKSNYWKKQCLHDAGTYSEAGLGSCAEASNYSIDDYDVDRHQNELGASRQSNAKQAIPNSGLRAELRETEMEIMIARSEERRV